MRHGTVPALALAAFAGAVGMLAYVTWHPALAGRAARAQMVDCAGQLLVAPPSHLSLCVVPSAGTMLSGYSFGPAPGNMILHEGAGDMVVFSVNVRPRR